MPNQLSQQLRPPGDVSSLLSMPCERWFTGFFFILEFWQPGPESELGMNASHQVAGSHRPNDDLP